MPVFKGLNSYGSGNETLPVVVLDIGDAYTKVGFAGESEPRAIIPTIIETIGSPPLNFLVKASDGKSRLEDAPAFKRNLHKFLEYIFFKILQVPPQKHCVIIAENLLMDTKLRQGLAEVLLKKLEVRSLLLAPHHLLACFTVAHGTCLVLDSGYNESVVLPVVEWTPLLWAYQAASLAGAVIHEEICTKMVESGSIMIESHEKKTLSRGDLTKQVIEDIKVKTCFIAKYERSRVIYEKTLAKWRKASSAEPLEGDDELLNVASPVPDVTYPVDGCTNVIIPGSLREEACEVLFQMDNDEINLATLLLDALLQSPIDSRKELASNIIVTGGTSMLPGFRHRLLKEMYEVVKTIQAYEKLKGCEFHVHNPPTLPNTVSWLGGSLVAAIQDFSKKFVTKEYYKQNGGRLPDWCERDLPPPESVPERKSTYTKTTFSPRRSADISAATRKKFEDLKKK